MKRSRQGEQPRIPLFTFLDVLICTMGALIVLLSLLVARAKEYAVTRAEERQTESSPTPAVDPEELKRLAEQEEDLQWRAEMLQQQRDAYAQDLANKRDELAHFEDHIRRLQDQAKQLMAQAEEMQKAGKSKLADRDGAMRQLAEMEREIEEKKKELEKSRKEVLRRRPAYAIVPYDGPNGTSRRPMYIECTEEGIVLQPEGVLLTAEDFQGPMGPGNPLDAALRATREHLKRGGLQSEPYPLVIVRPNGAIAFGACRNAMKHWESEFGYELVDQEAEIKYQPADPQLAELQKRAVADARQRQIALVAAMPKRFAGTEARLTSFRAADNQIGEEENGGGSGFGRARGTGGIPGTGIGGSGLGTGPRGATGAGGSGTSGLSSGYGERDSRLSLRESSAASAERKATMGGTANGQPGSNSVGQGSALSHSGQPTGNGNSNSGGTQPRGSNTQPGGASGQPGGASTAGGSPGGTSSQGSASGQSGGSSSQGSGGGSAGSSFSPPSSTASDGASGGSPQVNLQAGSPSPSASFSPQMEKARKKIKSRGENWGLPNASAKATGITRPIRAECAADRIVLYPERGDNRTPLIVPIEDDLTQNLDAVVASVWRHMEGWGLAVVGGYWKPVLVVDVKPGGEERFLELQQLLRGSGIEVEERK